MIYGTSEMLCDKGGLISLVIHLQIYAAVLQHIKGAHNYNNT